MLRPTSTTGIPPPSAPKDISSSGQQGSSKTQRARRTPSFLFDSPPSAPLAPTTSNATATSTSKPTKSKSKDHILSSSSPRRSFFPSPNKSSVSSGNSNGGGGGFAGGIFSLSSLLARMPSSASIAPVLSSHFNSDPPATTTMNSTKKQSSSKDKDLPRMTAAEKQEAVRNAHIILQTVRNDWDWHEELRKKRRKTDAINSTSPTNTLPSIRSEDEEDTDSESEDEREYKSRDESDSDDNRTRSSKSVYPDDEPKSAYRFHDPTSIGVPKPTKEERKQRRKKDLEEEMKWNEGLRIWVERRDLWTQADKKGRVPIGKSKFQDVSLEKRFDTSFFARWKDELTPIPPEYLPQNPFYDAIVPDAYPQLYSRIIIKGNTPTIPINLQHMTNALVEGWKADGQWPPKPTRPEPSMTKKKTPGESMVKRVFGIGR
ncbi:hypothetical protein TWF694_001921 [Orbilia ellipsospora]|uniref:Gag1-like clamp domain-containing protein n=1 Tax=Orbilia ellipsospora TaxID=2528407 RepID=A0AAV9X410_9PEZI